MDELINYLMHNPNNTNPNVVRDMLGNTSGSSSEEPNIEIVEYNYYFEGQNSPRVGFQGEDFIQFPLINLIENIKKGTINNLSEKKTYVVHLDPNPEDELSYDEMLHPATLKTVDPLTAEQIETLDTYNLDNGYYYTFNKQVSVLYRPGEVYLTQDQIDNDLTFIKNKEGGVS